jgi:hypothetical protein
LAAHVAVTDEHDLGVVAVVQDAGRRFEQLRRPIAKTGNSPNRSDGTMTLSWQRMG